MTDTTIAEGLAERIQSVAFDKLTADALHWAKVAVLDTVGCTLAGAHEECAQIIGRTATIGISGGECLVFGTNRRVGPLDAALINGTAAHALDYDDCSNTLGGHPSAPVVPALFALAELHKSSGKQFLTAYVAGWEAETRIARGVNFHHYEKGWHPTATLGVFGSAAGCAHLLGLSVAQTAKALALAATFSSGIKSNFGTMTKPLHVGHAARNGMLAALLAADGFTASANAFEHKQGFLNVFNGAGNYNADAILADWAEPWDIVSPGVAIKQYPCCGSTHAAIFLMTQLRREHGLTPDNVASITLLPHGRRLRHTNKPRPQTSLEAKFSVQYVCARALKDGAVRLKDFEGDAHFDPVVARLLDITEARPHPDMADDAVEQWGAEVIVTLKDGRTVSKRIENLVGRGGAYPMSADELWEKFADCAARSRPREQIAPLFERLETLETVADSRQVTRMAEVSALHRPPPRRVVLAPAGTEVAPETTWVP